jgi:hydrogenase maturation protease
MRRVPQTLAGRRVRLRDYGIGGMHLAYDLLDGCQSLVLVDALPTRQGPGTLHVFEANHDALSSVCGLDAHAMDPAAVFASLNALGGTPPYTVVIGCEVDNVEEGMGLSDAVAATVPSAVQAVQDVVTDLLARSAAGRG